MNLAKEFRIVKFRRSIYEVLILAQFQNPVIFDFFVENLSKHGYNLVTNPTTFQFIVNYHKILNWFDGTSTNCSKYNKFNHIKLKKIDRLCYSGYFHAENLIKKHLEFL
jgi:hypothetical protein